MSFSVTRNGITVEGESMTEVFEELACLDEVFGVTECGRCGGKKLAYAVRNVEDNIYHEIRCLDLKCGAKLPFNKNKDKTKKGGLYLEKKDKNGNWKPYNGWVKWDKEKQQEV